MNITKELFDKQSQQLIKYQANYLRVFNLLMAEREKRNQLVKEIFALKRKLGAQDDDMPTDISQYSVDV
jgi:hypothetical protein